MPGLIEDYGLIGDVQTAALVGAATGRLTGFAFLTSILQRVSPLCYMTRAPDVGSSGPQAAARQHAVATGARRSFCRVTGTLTKAPSG